MRTGCASSLRCAPGRPANSADFTRDLRIPLPPVNEPLDEIDHPLLAKARPQFTVPEAARERIRAIDDGVVWKVKIQHWRGAVRAADQIAWLIAAGTR
jgi:hypothetical protein